MVMIQRAGDRIISIGNPGVTTVGLPVQAESALTFTLRDDFTTDDAAPIDTPRTCEPGPGTLTFDGDTSRCSISGGVMQFAAVGSWTECNGHYGPFTRAGMALLFKLSLPVSNGSSSFGADTNNLTSPYTDYFWVNVTILYIYSCTGGGLAGVTLSTSTAYGFAVVLRSAGAFFLIRISGTWYLLMAAKYWTTNPLYMTFGAGGTPRGADYDTVRMIHLGDNGYADWATDTGIATYVDATPTAGDTATVDADGVQHFEWTAATGETLELSVRRTDDNNRWIVRCSQSGSTIKLIEVNGGVETERASTAQTFTNGTKYYIEIRHDGNAIRTWVNSANKAAYTSATFNATATGAKVAGFATGANWEAYPYEITGTAAAALDAALDAA